MTKAILATLLKYKLCCVFFSSVSVRIWKNETVAIIIKKAFSLHTLGPSRNYSIYLSGVYEISLCETVNDVNILNPHKLTVKKVLE